MAAAAERRPWRPAGPITRKMPKRFPRPLPLPSPIRSSAFPQPGRGQDDYFGCIALSSRNTGKLTILILESLAPLQEQIKAQRHTFYAGGFFLPWS